MQYVECSNQMLSQETLFFALRQMVMAKNSSDEEKEKEWKQYQSITKAFPYDMMMTAYNVLPMLMMKCLKMATRNFDQKCLKENLWRDDYNFTLI